MRYACKGISWNHAKNTGTKGKYDVKWKKAEHRPLVGKCSDLL